ncbi:MAG TPA: DinB family protein [Pyrinomonadaceae bacterium]|nr:DinB family protein [Pyrinomonadaceae bacterium]
MTEIERILDQLKRAYEGHAWHGPAVREALDGVTAAQAHARPLANAHTIWELVQHIAVWEDAGRRRVEGDRAKIEISSPEDWPPPEDTSEAAWEQAKAALDRGHQSLVAAVARVPESRLDEPILESMSTVYVTLHGVIQHDIYHAGQIAMLKKAVRRQ